MNNPTEQSSIAVHGGMPSTKARLLNPDKIEAAVLGAIISTPTAIYKAAGRLNPDFFTTKFNQTICQMLLDMQSEGINIDIYTMGEMLPAMVKVTGVATNDMYFNLVELTNAVSSDAHLLTHLDMLKERYIKRQLANLLLDSINKVNSSESVDLISNIQQKTVKLLEAKREADTLPHDSFINRLIENSSDKKNVLEIWGIPIIDSHIKGIANNDFVCVGGVPGSGKSSLLNNILVNAIKQEIGIYLWSGEMTILQTKVRAIAALSGISTTSIEKGFSQMSEREQESVKSYSLKIDELERCGMVTIRQGRMSCSQFQGEVLEAKFKNPNVKIAAADAMRLFTEVLDAKPNEEETQMGRVCRSMRSFCNSREVPVVMVAQLNKNGRGEVPRLKDIRGKGTDQEFTKVVFVHRPYALDPSNKELDPAAATLVLAKDNHGSLGTFDVDFIPFTTQFKGYGENELRNTMLNGEDDGFGNSVDVTNFF